MLRVVLTASTISALSHRLIFRVPAAQRKNILLSVLVWFLIGPGNSAAAVLSCTEQYPTMVVFIGLFTIYHVSTDRPDATAVATVPIQWKSHAWRVVALVGSCVSIE